MRFVIKRKTDASTPLEKIGAAQGVEIIDRIDDQAALIEATNDDAMALRNWTTGWTIESETTFAKPEPPGPRPSWNLP